MLRLTIIDYILLATILLPIIVMQILLVRSVIKDITKTNEEEDI